MWGGITASRAARLSMEPVAGAGHDRYRLHHGTEAIGTASGLLAIMDLVAGTQGSGRS